jgi:hypothetical protein
MELAEQPAGGFDIVLANPPYVEQEAITQTMGQDYKHYLIASYSHAFTGRSDLYVAFYARAHQLLKPRGVACFISSNKWLRAGYGEKLRQSLLDAQAFHLVVDFGELPVFQTAATFPAIFVWQKQERGNLPTVWAEVKDLDVCYESGIHTHIAEISKTVPASQFKKGQPRLAVSSAVDKRRTMEQAGIPLQEAVGANIYSGIKTGYNDAFWIDDRMRQELIDKDEKSADAIKKLARGDDIRKWHIRESGLHIIYTPPGFQISKYPAIRRHLAKYQSRLEARAVQQPWWELQQAQNRKDVWESPKIVYPDICKESRFTIDYDGIYIDMKGFIVSTEDAFILGVLNSSPVWWYLGQICAVLGDVISGGRLQLKRQYMSLLPIPVASSAERKVVEELAEDALKLQSQRRNRVEKFLRELGLSPAQSSSRNPLEQPWALTAEEFARKAKGQPARLYTTARDETMALTEEIAKVENEIDARVAALYGVD